MSIYCTYTINTIITGRWDCLIELVRMLGIYIFILCLFALCQVLLEGSGLIATLQEKT